MWALRFIRVRVGSVGGEATGGDAPAAQPPPPRFTTEVLAPIVSPAFHSSFTVLLIVDTLKQSIQIQDPKFSTCAVNSMWKYRAMASCSSESSGAAKKLLDGIEIATRGAEHERDYGRDGLSESGSGDENDSEGSESNGRNGPVVNAANSSRPLLRLKCLLDNAQVGS